MAAELAARPPARRDPPPRRTALGRRGRLLLVVFAAAAASWAWLGLSPADALPGETGRGVLLLFLEGMVTPALTYEGEVPPGTTPLLWKVVLAIRDTVLFAAAAMSLSLVIGLVLGVLGSTAWWADEEQCTRGRFGRTLRCTLLPAVYALVRAVIALMRSVHELLWAVLFLAALGLNSLAAVVAIAIPYGGTLAKVFSEMLDEAPRESARSLRAIGARPLQALILGLVPRAVGDMSAYAFYRFECAVRSSAILGFFGYPTLGYYIKLADENAHYRELWTYLYGLVAVVLVFEVWSAQLRKRVVIR